MDLKSSYFFDFSLFAHLVLFEQDPEPWIALSRLEAYLKTLPLGQLNGTISSQAYLVDPELITIEEGAIIEPGAYIRGPCWIGKHTVVRHGAYLRGGVLTGEHCVIGHDTEVKNSLFLDRSHAAHFAYVGDCILGQEVNLGAGTKCANFKLDKQAVTIHCSGRRIPTHLRKLGAIVGDRSQLGCNSVTNPGTLIGKDVRCYPCLNIGGFILSQSIIKPSQEPRIISLRDQV